VTATGEAARRVALDAMLRIDEGAYAHILVPQLLRRRHLSVRDRAFVTDLVYGTVRMRRALDFLLQRVSNRPIEQLDPEVRAALRLGAYQLLNGVPAHAAVSETVNVVPTRARGFVNGVLRGLARNGPPWVFPEGKDVGSIGIRTSHPDWIVEVLLDAYGIDDALATLELDNTPPAVTLRTNRLLTAPDALAAELETAGIDVSFGALVPDALVLRHTGDLAALPAIREGRATPQDQTSQAIVAVLDPQPGERVLDLASAPGGKATAAAERMHNDGVIVAADLHPGRARTVQRTAARLGAEPAVHAIVADGQQPAVRPASFDRVLLDAPCSGLGVLRRRPDARWRLQADDVRDLAALQRRLLAAAADAVKPGGRLVYAVCTITPDETVGIDAWAADHLPEFTAEPPPEAPWRAAGRGALLLPGDAQTDGMFVLSLRRAPNEPDVDVPAETVAAPDPEPQPERPTPSPPPAAEANPRRWHAVRSTP
jgi:16S rRNA (cytosine967-C5)-methyltransferase